MKKLIYSTITILLGLLAGGSLASAESSAHQISSIPELSNHPQPPPAPPRIALHCEVQCPGGHSETIGASLSPSYMNGSTVEYRFAQTEAVCGRVEIYLLMRSSRSRNGYILSAEFQDFRQALPSGAVLGSSTFVMGRANAQYLFDSQLSMGTPDGLINTSCTAHQVS